MTTDAGRDTETKELRARVEELGAGGEFRHNGLRYSRRAVDVSCDEACEYEVSAEALDLALQRTWGALSEPVFQRFAAESLVRLVDERALAGPQSYQSRAALLRELLACLKNNGVDALGSIEAIRSTSAESDSDARPCVVVGTRDRDILGMNVVVGCNSPEVAEYAGKALSIALSSAGIEATDLDAAADAAVVLRVRGKVAAIDTRAYGVYGEEYVLPPLPAPVREANLRSRQAAYRAAIERLGTERDGMSRYGLGMPSVEQHLSECIHELANEITVINRELYPDDTDYWPVEDDEDDADDADDT